MIGLNIYWYFYKKYFIERFKLLLKKEKMKFLKDEINSEVLYFSIITNRITLVKF
jgi:hypothetical protein